MRAVAIEKMLRAIIKNSEDVVYLDGHGDGAADKQTNLLAKASILINRNDNRSASVIKEILNERI